MLGRSRHRKKVRYCKGDSGGPVILKEDINSLIAIVSFGKPCGSKSPGLYTSIYDHLEWIESVVWPKKA